MSVAGKDCRPGDEACVTVDRAFKSGLDDASGGEDPQVNGVGLWREGVVISGETDASGPVRDPVCTG